MKVLVTGTAGFIGSHVALKLLERGDEVIGFDSLNDYYDVRLKKARLARFIEHPRYTHIHADLADRARSKQLSRHSTPCVASRRTCSSPTSACRGSRVSTC